MNADQFVQLLRRSNLLTEERFAAFLSEHGGQTAPEVLSHKLVTSGDITSWQANELLSGNTAFFVGKYKLVDCLGQGGMGAVYKAYHPFLDRTVALKVILKQMVDSPEAIIRFQREMRSVAALNHPNVIAAHDADMAGDTPFLVMEYVDGQDLTSWMEENGTPPIEWSCDCIRQAALGLQHASEKGMVHRDIKPGNLLVLKAPVGTAPTVKILDFGLAQLRGAAEQGRDLTQTGQVMGTVDYMAPEQARSTKDVDIRCDIFALGCTLFKMLTGRVPYEGETFAVRLAARITEDAPPVSRFRQGIPHGIEDVVRKMLQREPDDRYQTPQSVADALQWFSRPARSSRSRAQRGSMPQERSRRAERSQVVPRSVPQPASPPAAALPPRTNVPKRNQHNDQLTSFYGGLGIAAADLCNCAACELIIPRNPPSPTTVGVNFMLALQNATQTVMSYTLIMKGLLGDQHVVMPTEASGMINFLDQFVAVKCQGCGQALCPACRTGHATTNGCVLCGHRTAAPEGRLISGPLDLTVDKMHGATLAAAITKLDSATDQEYREFQQVALGSAIKMAQSAKAGESCQFLGLALREFCNAIEARPTRPINREVIKQIRDYVDNSLPAQVDPSVMAEFQQAMRFVR